MIAKIITALLTGFLITLLSITFIGIIISASYTFIFQIAFWLGITKRAVIIILALIALVVSLMTFASIMDKD